MYILNLLKNALPEPSKELPSTRLPTYTTLILLHALRGIFYPSHFLYPLTSRFLLQRPELDPGDVPMLYSMLYSSSDDWKRERLWVVRFLADGMVCYDDWKVLKRRHTWDLLASFFQSSEKDDSMRNAVLEVKCHYLSVWGAFSHRNICYRCSQI
jgi:nucleolar pre-ribosomal-associated protein 1